MLKTILDYFSPPISFKKWFAFACILLLMWLGIFTWIYAQTIIRSLFFKEIYLEALNEQIFVSPKTDSLQHYKILSLYQESKKRIDSLFGNTQAKPSIIIATDSELMKMFGDVKTTTGMTHLTPFGAVVIIGVEGLNVDVISHELCHAELMHRTGWYVRWKKIPIWFDEGLAMQVDTRFDYWHQLSEDWEYFQQTEPQEEFIRIEAKKTAQDFFTKEAKLHYFLAQQKVRKWYQIHQQKGLLQFIEQIKNKDFDKSFELE